MLDSFITLNRRILELEWYTDSNTMRLFIHCLLKANWKDKDWKGVVVKRGTFITSQQGLADQLGIHADATLNRRRPHAGIPVSRDKSHTSPSQSQSKRYFRSAFAKREGTKVKASVVGGGGIKY